MKYRKVGNYDNLYISESDINAIEDEVSFIKANFPIGNQKSEHNFLKDSHMQISVSFMAKMKIRKSKMVKKLD